MVALAPHDVELTQGVAAELRAQGRHDRAAALEAVLAAATAAASTGATEGAAANQALLTVQQAAQALGVSSRDIRTWAVAGHIRLVESGGQVFVPQGALLRYVEQLREEHQEYQARTDSTQATGLTARQAAFVAEGIPKQVLSRLEVLHDKMESGERLTAHERREAASLERDALDTAAERLRTWTQQLGGSSS